MIDGSIDAIIFDFGGVLINIDYQATINAFEKLGGNDFNTLYTQASQSHLFDRLETGEISPQYFINQLLELLPPSTPPNKVVHAWNTMILDIPLSVIELLDSLKKKYKLYLLSNTNQIHIDKALVELSKVTNRPLDDFFEKVYLSHQVKLRKPNTSIFEFVIKDQNLDPEKTLFIDDSIQHIEGAEKVGLKTYHLSNQKNLYSLFS